MKVVLHTVQISHLFDKKTPLLVSTEFIILRMCQY